MGPGLVDSGLTEALMHGASLGLQVAHTKASLAQQQFIREQQLERLALAQERLQNQNLWHGMSNDIAQQRVQLGQDKLDASTAAAAAKSQGQDDSLQGLLGEGDAMGIFANQKQDPAWHAPMQLPDGGTDGGAAGPGPQSTGDPQLDALMAKYGPQAPNLHPLDRAALTGVHPQYAKSMIGRAIQEKVKGDSTYQAARDKLVRAYQMGQARHLQPAAIEAMVGDIMGGVTPDQAIRLHQEFDPAGFASTLAGLTQPMPAGQEGPPAPLLSPEQQGTLGGIAAITGKAPTAGVASKVLMPPTGSQAKPAPFSLAPSKNEGIALANNELSQTQGRLHALLMQFPSAPKNEIDAATAQVSAAYLKKEKAIKEASEAQRATSKPSPASLQPDSTPRYTVPAAPGEQPAAAPDPAAAAPDHTAALQAASAEFTQTYGQEPSTIGQLPPDQQQKFRDALKALIAKHMQGATNGR